MTSALFERDGDRVVPNAVARGPWRPDALHGGAVAALLASAFSAPGRLLTRMTFDLLAPVPVTPLVLDVSPLEGGERVARQVVTLLDGDRVVARGQCVAVRATTAEVPPPAVAASDPFHDWPVPEMTRTRTRLAEQIGWECFDSGAIAVRGLKSPSVPGHLVGLYVTLLAPVIAGEPVAPIARVAAAADYASNAVGARLPFDRWSFMNAELSVHVARPPVGTWVGLLSDGILGGSGSGFSAAPMFDESGRLGLAAQALVVERRERVAEEVVA